MRNFKIALLTVSILSLTAQAALAEPSGEIYKWQDSKGMTHYSSKPVSPNAKPADLPRITKADMKMPNQPKTETCASHGGIDCQAGADKDGSVICSDGFAGAGAPYRFSCNAPKLMVTEILPTVEGGYRITVRNAKSVTAAKPTAFFQRPNGKEVPLSAGDVSEIKPFGVAEFTLEKTDAGDLKDKPMATQFRLSCANCP